MKTAAEPKTLVKPKLVHVIVNPAPAKRTPLLGTLNGVFREAGILWDVFITHGPGDGRRLARQSVAAGAEVVAVYGGDGTVMEVASGLVETGVPMLVLGGGTGNLVAAELRLPSQLEKCCQLICGDRFKTRAIDVGMAGEQPFLLRVGCGIEVGAVQEATRELKNQFGKWAYVFGVIKQLQETPEAEYKLTFNDGKTVEGRAIACIVANAGTVGVGRLTLSPAVGVDDGMLDAFLIKKANIEGILHLAQTMMGINKSSKGGDGDTDEPVTLDASRIVEHWCVKSVEIESDPVLEMQVDGDIVAQTPKRITTLSKALRVVVS